MSGVGLGMHDLGWWGTGLAYVNPGTGTLIIQMVMAGMAGAYLWLRRSGMWVKSFFSKKKKSGE